MKTFTTNVKTFQDGDWNMDYLMKPDGTVEVWLYRSSIGVKMFVYGFTKDNAELYNAEKIAVNDFENDITLRENYDEQFN